MKYLYYRGRYTDNSVYRVQVTRETNSNYWIKANNDSEIRISKRTMSVGDTWSKTFYKEETPELLSEYNSSLLKRKFLRQLDLLKDCEDENIMKQIISIKIKKVGE